MELPFSSAPVPESVAGEFISSSEYQAMRTLFQSTHPFYECVGKISPYTKTPILNKADYELYCHLYIMKQQSAKISAEASQKTNLISNQLGQAHDEIRNMRKPYKRTLFMILVAFGVFTALAFLPQKSTTTAVPPPEIPQEIEDHIEYKKGYLTGYSDAIHGTPTDEFDIPCYSCGGYYNISYYDTHGIAIPLCEDCISSHANGEKMLILDEYFTFQAAKAEE